MEHLDPVACEVGRDLNHRQRIMQWVEWAGQSGETDDGTSVSLDPVLSVAAGTTPNHHIVASLGKMIRQVDGDCLCAAGIEAGHQLQDADQGCSPRLV